MTYHFRTRLARIALIALMTAGLVCLAASSASAADETPKTIEELERQYEEAVSRGDLKAAVEIAEEIYWTKLPAILDAIYDITALHVKLGDTEQAYDWLEHMLDTGFWDFRRLLGDEDFAPIRDDERFKNLVRRVQIERYLEMLERPERDEFQKPEQVMETLAFKPGEKVADIGAGSGYFTIPVAKAVGDDGLVWAIDIRPEMLDHIDARLEAEGLSNVRLMLVDPDDPQLPAGKVDTILLVDTWHYIRDPEYAKKLRDGLAPGGRIAVIDYRPKPWDERPWGPPPQQQTPREEIDEHFAEAGLVPVESYDFLPEQYFVIYKHE